MPNVSPLEHPLLYRAIRDKRWIVQRSAAFVLRKPTEANPEPESDLSFILSATCTKSVCNAGLVRYCGGEFILETQAVLSVAENKGWQVDKDASNHARILGLPLHGSPKRLIEDAATALEKLIVSFKPRPTED